MANTNEEAKAASESGQLSKSQVANADSQQAAYDPLAAPPASPPPEPLPPKSPVQRYEQRIRVLEAYRFDGKVAEAPEWINRNWLTFDHGEDHPGGREPGPSLTVPGQKFVCLVGDYVVKQAVLIAKDVPEDISVEVWKAHEFERLFIPLPPIDAVIGDTVVGRKPDPYADSPRNLDERETT